MLQTMVVRERRARIICDFDTDTRVLTLRKVRRTWMDVSWPAVEYAFAAKAELLDASEVVICTNDLREMMFALKSDADQWLKGNFPSTYGLRSKVTVFTITKEPVVVNCGEDTTEAAMPVGY